MDDDKLAEAKDRTFTWLVIGVGILIFLVWLAWYNTQAIPFAPPLPTSRGI